MVETSLAVANTSGRLAKITALADLLRTAGDDEIDIVVTFLSGRLRQGRVGVGWSIVSKVRDVPPAADPSLTLHEVDERFARLASTAGGGVAKTRVALLSELFARATAAEQDFLVRLISGELRQGALEGVLTDAIARAAGVPADVVRQASMMCGDLAEVAKTALTRGAEALTAYSIEIFRPVEPMLATPVESIAEVLASFGDAAFEFKLDGARIQVHKSADDVRVYSRALRDVTAAVPEVVEAVRRLPARQLILDGEVIALQSSGAPLPFQETMRRFGRRLEVDRLRGELPLTPFAFDCLYLDGRSLTSLPQRERFAALVSVAAPMVVAHEIVTDEKAASDFFNRAIASGHEGVMAKSLDAPYAAGSRGSAWLKIKQVRSLDLVVLAAEWGSGRRKGWLSNLHLGARRANGDEFVMLGKTFKGMTDEVLEWQTTELLTREVKREGHVVYVRPELVVEIAFNDVQESPHYPGGLTLRFARLKAYRPDKTAEQADTLETLQDIYRATTGRVPPPVR